MNRIDLAGRNAVVTGGASGIGFAIARRLLESGARVEIWGRDVDKLASAVARLASLGTVTHRRVDVTDFANVRNARDALGPVDILVNCAGASPALGLMADMTYEDWHHLVSANLHSVFYCCKAFLPSMIEAGWGRIINVSSMAGKEGNPFQSAYSAAKGGVLAFTKSVAKEVATTGVTVNAIAPALFDTPLVEVAKSEHPEAIGLAFEKIPMKRLGMPAEAAALVAWIASDECSFTTGFTFDLSGGRATY